MATTKKTTGIKMPRKLQIRFEIMCLLENEGKANDMASNLSDIMEDKFGIDCAIVVIDANRNKEIEAKIN